MNERDQALVRAKAGLASAIESYGMTSDPAIRATFAALIESMAGLIEAVELCEINAMLIAARRMILESTP